MHNMYCNKDIFDQLISIGEGKLLTNHESRYFMFHLELTLASH